MKINCANPTCTASVHVESQRQISKSAAFAEGVLRSVGWSMVIQDGAWVGICERCAKDEQ